MTAGAASERALCDTCGEPVSENGWIGIEVNRPTESESAVGGVDYLYAIFCRQEHAARWMAAPLPEPEPVRILPRTWGDRFFDLLFVPGIVVTLLLAVVGLWMSVRWIASLF